MAVVKQRLNMKTETGYTTVHLETSSDLVLRADGTTIETTLVNIENTLDSKAEGTHTHSEISNHINNKDNPHGVTPSQIGAAVATHTHTAADVGALPSNTSYVPPTRKVNGKALSADITLSASDVGAAASSHTHSYAATSHSHAAGTITAGTLLATVLAATGTDYTTSRLRNIKAGTSDLTAGSSALTNGEIYLVYE